VSIRQQRLLVFEQRRAVNRVVTVEAAAQFRELEWLVTFGFVEPLLRRKVVRMLAGCSHGSDVFNQLAVDSAFRGTCRCKNEKSRNEERKQTKPTVVRRGKEQRNPKAILTFHRQANRRDKTSAANSRCCWHRRSCAGIGRPAR